MEKNYKNTIVACFIAYVVQAIINNFVPLLFLMFHETYQIPLSQITLLVTFNFGMQLFADLISVGFVDKLGYRASMILAHITSAVGLVLLTILPEMLPSAFVGILISVMIYAIGGGIIEVLVSPIVEACPTENKEKAMSLLHSFYSWGYVGVVLLSTIFFWLFGIRYWKVMALIWAAVPLVNMFAFLKVPIVPLIKEEEEGMRVGELLKNKMFWILFLMMLCAGASEQSVSQWASVLMEKGFGISKTIGDLAGPMMFAVLMGCARAFYGKYGEKIKLDHFMIGSCILAIASYLGIVFLQIPQLSLIACAFSGLAVGIMWPGTFSKAALVLRKGGTAMFALLALSGDLGCSLGPSVVGIVSGLCQDNIKLGIFAAVVFPVLLLFGILGCKNRGVPRED